MKKVTTVKKIKETGSDLVFDIIVHVLAVLITIIVAFPLLYVLGASFCQPTEIVKGHFIPIPGRFSLDAYRMILKDEMLLRGYANTIYLTVVGTALNLVMTILCAYPLSRKKMFGHNVLTMFVTFTMFFGAGMIPNYLLVKELKLLDTYWSLILPSAISVYNMLIMRNFFQNSIPDELFDAARIDGCGNIKTLTRIVLPLSKGIMAVMIVFYAVGHWNAYFSAMVYLNTEEKYPLQLVLRNILLESETYAETGSAAGYSTANASLLYVSVQYATIVASSLPIILVYSFAQKHFVKGVMIGAVKG